MDTPRLCYIDNCWAYFTTQPLDKQWGDDWDDAPYEHNAGEPYTPCWHNDPEHRNDLKPIRGWKPGTKTPLETGELCRCSSCEMDWNEDGTPKYAITKVAFDAPLSPPSGDTGNSPFSVRDINAGMVAWLRSVDRKVSPIMIFAGATLEEFARAIRLSGGTVYFPGK